MVREITSNVIVSVETTFLEKSSSSKQFLFSYAITIQNKNNCSIQLLSRHWKIQDSLAETRYVNGQGVIGEQPIILPGETYRYESYCDLKSNIGFMEGSYIFAKEDNQELIEVRIPRFELSLPTVLN